MHSFLKTYYRHTTHSLYHHFSEVERKSRIPATPKMSMGPIGISEEEKAKSGRETRCYRIKGLKNIDQCREMWVCRNLEYSTQDTETGP